MKRGRAGLAAAVAMAGLLAGCGGGPDSARVEADAAETSVSSAVPASTSSTASTPRTSLTSTTGTTTSLAPLPPGHERAIEFDPDEPVDEGPVGDGTTPSDEVDEVDLSVEVPRSAVVGESVDLTVTLTNTSGGELMVDQSYLCGAIAEVSVLEQGLDVDAEVVRDTGRWTGNLSSLQTHLRDEVIGEPGLRGFAAPVEVDPYPQCNRATVPPTSLGAGESLEQAMTLDLRWGRGPVDDVELKASASVLMSGSWEDTAVGAQEATVMSVSAETQVIVEDDPLRLDSLDAAVGPKGLVAAPTLARWLTSTADRPSVSGDEFDADLSWSEGAWEMAIEAPTLDIEYFNARWDPTSGEVSLVWLSGPDGPGSTKDVRYEAD